MIEVQDGTYFVTKDGTTEVVTIEDGLIMPKSEDGLVYTQEEFFSEGMYIVQHNAALDKRLNIDAAELYNINKYVNLAVGVRSVLSSGDLLKDKTLLDAVIGLETAESNLLAALEARLVEE